MKITLTHILLFIIVLLLAFNSFKKQKAVEIVPIISDARKFYLINDSNNKLLYEEFKNIENKTNNASDSSIFNFLSQYYGSRHE